MKISLSHVISCDKSANVQTHSQNTFMWCIYYSERHAKLAYTHTVKCEFKSIYVRCTLYTVQRTHICLIHPFVAICSAILHHAMPCYATQCSYTWFESAFRLVFHRYMLYMIYIAAIYSARKGTWFYAGLFIRFVLSISPSLLCASVCPPVCLSVCLSLLFDIEPYERKT